MGIKLSDHFNYKKMIRFTFPSVIMILFTSIYGIVDGYFVSNLVGKTPFAAVNFIMPVLMILSAIGFMFGSGGSALIAKTLGEGKKEKASELFSMFVFITILAGAVIAILSFLFMRPIATFLGAEGQLLDDAVRYGRIIILALPFCMLQFEFQSFFITAEKPKLGLLATVVAGVTNMVLDYLFMAVFKMGIVGAAWATAISQIVGGIIPIIYFIKPNPTFLRLTKFRYDGKALIKAITNGSSELMTNISLSVVSMLYNVQFLKYAGENGIAAYGVIMYVNLIFLSVYIGFSTGLIPVIGYHFGAKNNSELKGLLKKSIVVIGVSSVLMFVLSELLAYPLSYIFVGYDKELMDLTLRGFYIYSFSYLFAGGAIFGSSFFTALNDGLTSALISFLRTLLFQIVAVLIFPLLWGIDGIWTSLIFAEIMAVIITVIFIILKRKKYNYI